MGRSSRSPIMGLGGLETASPSWRKLSPPTSARLLFPSTASTNSTSVSSPSPLAIASMTGYSMRLGSARAVKCCPPVIVWAPGAALLAVSRALTTV